MGLTNDQIALGVALMYVESKYDPNAKILTQQHMG